MTNYVDVYKDFKKLSKQEKKIFTFLMLKEGEVSYTELSELYVKVLEGQAEYANKKESLFASCLSSYIQKYAHKKSEAPFFQSQAYVLGKDR
jgi:hypothetical protein